MGRDNPDGSAFDTSGSIPGSNSDKTPGSMTSAPSAASAPSSAPAASPSTPLPSKIGSDPSPIKASSPVRRKGFTMSSGSKKNSDRNLVANQGLRGARAEPGLGSNPDFRESGAHRPGHDAPNHDRDPTRADPNRADPTGADQTQPGDPRGPAHFERGGFQRQGEARGAGSTREPRGEKGGRRGVQVDPRLAEGLRLQQRGEIEGAADCFNAVLKQNPRQPAALYSMAVIEQLRGHPEKALDWINRCLQMVPNFQQAHDARAVILKSMRGDAGPKRPEMPPLPDKSGKPDPRSAMALALQSQGRAAEARALYEAILQDSPDDFVSLYSLCIVAMQDKQPHQALAYIDRAVASIPEYPPGHFARGTVLQAVGLFDDALRSFDEALRLKPDYGEALNNKANLLHTLHRHHEALVCLEQAARLDPTDDKALGNLGYILTEYKRNALAAEYFSKLLALNPYYDYAQGLRAYALLHCCDWTGYHEHRAGIREGIALGRRVCNPLAFMALSDEPPEQLRCAQIFSHHRFPPDPNPLWNGTIYRHRKIRVGYVSPDFREHPVGHALCGVLEKHDRTGFEVFGLSLGLDDKGSLRKRYKLLFDHFIEARELLASELAHWVRSMEIDVLVDLAGYTSGSRADMFAMRPAPIQVTYLGFPGTSGAPYMDYILADKVVIPNENRSWYQEQVVWLPHAYFPADNTVAIAEATPSRAACGLPDEGFVFCSFNHDYKINPPVFGVWMRLLRAVPGSVLWLMKLNEDAQGHLLRSAEAAGVEASRIVFATRVPRIEDHLARYRQADLFLDTHPYNAHTTANDAIRAGLPLLTMLGGSFPSRVAASLLTTLGMHELIATSLEDYEARALRWAQHPEELAALRTRMASLLPGNPLFDSLRQARALEVAYQVMVSRYQRGLGPGPIEVRG